MRDAMYIFVMGAASLSATYLPSIIGFFLLANIIGIVFCYERLKKRLNNLDENKRE